MQPVTTTDPKTHLNLKQLNLRTRNQARSILAVESVDALKILNRIRERQRWQEILQIERLLRAQPAQDFLPSLFPTEPQTTENYYRLSPISVEKQIAILGALATENIEKITGVCVTLGSVNSALAKRDFLSAAKQVVEMVSTHGYSHLALRKAALIQALGTDDSKEEIKPFLIAAGIGKQNTITSSLLHCYQEEQDILSLKRSIMSLPSRGIANKFTRDISRLVFHPHAKNELDLNDLIQSALQSSLIDAVLLLKINRHLAVLQNVPASIQNIFKILEKASSSVEIIAGLYQSSLVESEGMFFKHSSAWYENTDIIEYRFALDHFNDVPEASYLSINEEILKRAAGWLIEIPIRDLSETKALSRHTSVTLRNLENTGFHTRSASFNFALYRSQGFEEIEEANLMRLMSKTLGLAKTSPPQFLRNLALSNPTPRTKLVLLLLIARKSKNEGDDYQLRRILQQITRDEYAGDLVSLVRNLADFSPAIGEYAYDVFTEDFIAKLSHLIKSTSEITETRAALHTWMGQHTGEKGFFDRARTLLIDHQINKVRNEIDDNRIYVDASRFAEWINDELLRELSQILTGLKHKNTPLSEEDPQLLNLIERCYSTFCQNRIFGIASYLGRRIRHGTFKGHLYHAVIGAIERHPKYKDTINEPCCAKRWEHWKQEYEAKVDNMIKDRLHVEASDKREGFLKANLKSTGKAEIAIGCAKNIVTDYFEHNSTESSAQLLIDYCWRLAEVDLRNFNAWLKNQKGGLINQPLLQEIKISGFGGTREIANEFCRDVVRTVDEKLLAMSNWFKRPSSVAPKASMGLLYKAVVAEVQETYPDFSPLADFDEKSDIDLFGGAYHVLYDSFYVAVFNAAKHGKQDGQVNRVFRIERDPRRDCLMVVVEISSEIRDDDDDDAVNIRLKEHLHCTDDIENAQINEGRSGLRKLYQLQLSDKNFFVESIKCENRYVDVRLSYALLY